MKIVAVDESGYNGGNLLDSERTWMSLSVVDIRDSVAEDLIKRHLPQLTSGDEVKHTRLYGCAKYDDGLVALQREAYEVYEASSYVINKRVACCEAFILDCVAGVWPQFVPGSKAYCNLIFRLVELSKTNAPFFELLKSYLAFSNGGNSGELRFLADLGRQTDKFVQAIGARLWQNPYALAMIDKTHTAEGLIDGMLLELIRLIDSKSKEEFMVCYDESDEIDDFARTFMEQVGKPRNKGMFRWFKGLQSGKSCEHRSIQVADVLAGGVIRFAKTVNGEELENECRTVYGRKMKDMLVAVKRKDALLFKFDFDGGDYQSQVLDITNFWMA